MAERDQETVTQFRKRQKPVINADGQLVTPVSGLPAAPINWAPACPVCRTRVCRSCHQHNAISAKECRYCGSDNLADGEQCTDTISVGTKESQVGMRQRCKCRQCGYSWAWTVTPKANT